MATLLDFLDREIGRIVQCCRAVRINEHQFAKDAVSRRGEVLNQLRAIVETYEEEVVVTV